MKKVFIDANIILDVLMKRKPFYINSSRILSLGKQKTIDVHASSSCFTDMYYVLRRLEGNSKALELLRRISGYVEILSVDSDIIHRAFGSGYSDFEDAVQYCTAVRHNMQCLITRNAKDYKAREIPVISPPEFLKMFKPGEIV